MNSAPPPGALSARTDPPCCSATCRTIASPSPEPGRPRAEAIDLTLVLHRGESVTARVPGFTGRPVGDLVLRGRSEPLRAFEPLSPEEYEAQGTRAYLDAYRRLEAGDPSAMPAFAALLGLRGDDQLVSFHLKRLLNGATGARIMLD